MSHLFSAGPIGGLELENCIVVSPMCMYSAVDGVPQPAVGIRKGDRGLPRSPLGMFQWEFSALSP